jgi:hypothetical protein
VSVRFEFRFFNRPIQFLGLKFRFLYLPILLVHFEFRFFNRPILFFGFKFRFLYRAIVSASFLSNKTNAVKMVGNWLAGPSKMDFGEAFMGGPVLSKLFVSYSTITKSKFSVSCTIILFLGNIPASL